MPSFLRVKPPVVVQGVVLRTPQSRQLRRISLTELGQFSIFAIVNWISELQISRRRIAWVTLAISIVLMALKFAAYSFSESKGILSDALESIVNVLTGMVGIWVAYISALPPDENHPYGHGKIEYFSAAFEGGLIFFASIVIFGDAVKAIVDEHQLRDLNLGMVLMAIAGIANGVLGLVLKSFGRKTHSLALVGSAEHILSDFWTTVGVLVGLVCVKLTGIVWLDSVAAILVALHLGWVGSRLVWKSSQGLMDTGDQEILSRLCNLLEKNRKEGIIRVHHTRVIQVGAYHHVDAHVVVPEYWSVSQAHDVTDAFEHSIFQDSPTPGEIVFHVDPCRRAYCRECDVVDCPVREEKFRARRAFSLEEIRSLVEPDEVKSDQQNQKISVPAR